MGVIVAIAGAVGALVTLLALVLRDHWPTPAWLRRLREWRLRRAERQLQPLEEQYAQWFASPPLGTVVRDKKRHYAGIATSGPSYTRVGRIAEFPRPTFEEEHGANKLWVHFENRWDGAPPPGEREGQVAQVPIRVADCDPGGQYELVRTDEFPNAKQREKLLARVATLRVKLPPPAKRQPRA